MFLGHVGHPGTAGVGQPGDGPLPVLLGVEAEGGLVAAGLDVVPNFAGRLGALAGRACGEAIAQLGGQLAGLVIAGRPRKAGAWAALSAPGLPLPRTS